MSGNTTQQRERFQSLVRRAEALGEADPSAYKRRIVLLALLGYAMLFGVLFLLLALIVGSVWAAFASGVLMILLFQKKLILVLGYLVYSIARALWVKIEPPQGYELDLKRFPELAAVLADLRRQLATPRIHRVLLTEEFNAGITQTPRLGIFGWYRNTLILGLQLMLVMSPEQAKAVLAHELGHLSGNHSRFAAWIYRVRQTWYRVMEAFHQSGHWGGRWLARFFDWYAPHFNAFSFVLARANEYEADALSAQLTSREVAASALIATHVGVDYLAQAYWQPFLAQADAEPRPPCEPYRAMAGFLTTPPADSTPLRIGLDKALAVETGYTDTHPALKDRLQSLGAQALPPAPVATSAARAWLGERYEAVLADFDQAWLQRNGKAWEERHRAIEEIRTKHTDLIAKPEDQLSQEECWQRAAWSEQLGLDAMAHYRAYAAAYPDDPDADLALGRLLLERDDADGLTYIERAADRFNLALAACNVAHAYCQRIGDRTGAEAWLRRGEQQFDLETAARQERASVTVKDTLTDAGLDQDGLADLARQLSELSDVKHAWICRKAVKVLPDNPVYVLAVEGRNWFVGEDKLLEKVIETIAFPGHTFIVMKGAKAAKLANRVIRAGSKIL